MLLGFAYPVKAASLTTVFNEASADFILVSTGAAEPYYEAYQSLVPIVDVTDVTFSVNLFRWTSGDTGTVRTFLYADNAGVPDRATVLYTGPTLDITTLATGHDGTSQTFAFGSVALTSGVKVWLGFTYDSGATGHYLGVPIGSTNVSGVAYDYNLGSATFSSHTPNSIWGSALLTYGAISSSSTTSVASAELLTVASISAFALVFIVFLLSFISWVLVWKR